MKILYFYQYFGTPRGSWSTRVYDFSQRWIEQGAEVTVVTSVYEKSDLRAKGLVDTQVIDGIKVHIVNVVLSNKKSVPARIFDFLKYAVLSCWYALTCRCDVVVASSGPITVGIPGLLCRILRRKPFLFEVRDLWPQGAIELGYLRNPIMKFIALTMEKICYRFSTGVIALSPGMKEGVLSKNPRAQVDVVPNSANLKVFAKQVDIDLPVELRDRKFVIYAGNIGEVNRSDHLWDVAVKLHEMGRDDVCVVLIGDGKLRQELVDNHQDNPIPTFLLKGLVPKEELAGWIQAATASLVLLQPSPTMDTSSPNKLFDSLAASTPVIQSTAGWIADLVKDHNCGINVTGQDSRETAEAILSLVDDQKATAEMGEAAFELAKSEFEVEGLADRMYEVIERVTCKPS